jgi:hypothetical protein
VSEVAATVVEKEADVKSENPIKRALGLMTLVERRSEAGPTAWHGRLSAASRPVQR